MVVVEPSSDVVEFGNNVKTVSYMSIDDYFGRDYDSWVSDNNNDDYKEVDNDDNDDDNSRNSNSSSSNNNNSSSDNKQQARINTI